MVPSFIEVNAFCFDMKLPLCSSPDSDSEEIFPSTSSEGHGHLHGIKIVGDNIDKTVRRRFMCCDRQTRSLHYFHSFAVLDRFNIADYSEDLPRIPVKPPLEELLPSQTDIRALEDNFAVHVGRIVCKYMPFFSENFRKVVPAHIQHPFVKEMSQKSKVVCT